jgi:DNA repair protein RadC
VETEQIVDALPIREWHVTERPREKLLSFGASKLSTGELLGLILGSGTRGTNGPVSAVQVGIILLKRYESLRDLASQDVRELMRVEGLGIAKAAQLVAAFELGRRIEADPGKERLQISSPDDVARVFIPLMRDLRQEEFRVVFLNTASVVIGVHTISTGGLAASIVEPRAVFQQAVLANAGGLICVHNHPSGNPEPSAQDISITKRLVDAGTLMGIPVHDHVIIAGPRYTSMARRGVI